MICSKPPECSDSYVLPTSFTYGTPFTISASVADGAEEPFAEGGSAEFQLIDLEIVDASGNLLPGELEPASGTVYQLDSAPVPEPSSVFLFGFCLVACLWRVRLIPLFDSITPTVPSRPKRDP
jgi:hypothetical protein